MPTALPNTKQLVQYGAALIRMQALDTDCTVLTGTGVRAVSSAIVSLTATPVLKEGQEYTIDKGNGDQLIEIKRQDKIRRWDLSGEIAVFDLEQMALMFGGATVLGDVGSDFAAEVMGYVYPGLDAPDRAGVYFEVIGALAEEGAGDCVGGSTGVPAYRGHIFPRVRFTPGEFTMENEIARLQFTAQAFSNPTMSGTGPFADYDGVGGVPTAAHSIVDYSALPAGDAVGVQDVA